MDSKVSFSDSNIMIITFFLFKKEKRRCRNGKHHRGKEGGRIKTWKPDGRASGIWKKENGKPRAAFLVFELIGRRTAATVKLLGKRINNDSCARRSGSKQGHKKRRRKRRRSDFLLTIFLKYGIIPLSNEGNSPRRLAILP